MTHEPIPGYVEGIARQVVDAAFHVHNALGPGLLESVYEECLAYELSLRGVHSERQKALPLTYKEKQFDKAFRVDLLVEDTVIVELKSVELLLPLHDAQLYTYLRFAGKRLGILINFNTKLIKHGIRRIVR